MRKIVFERPHFLIVQLFAKRKLLEILNTWDSINIPNVFPLA